ncbi:MAG: putative DNA binding domain-containing protein [Verrucomicrobiales bacterium]|nr:putative DNA binding domain-containing protein [Verrucomicrobiales bacterium]
MKVLYPHRECTAEETREILQFSMECRKRVKDHILRIDETFERKTFEFVATEGGTPVITVKTPEEIANPVYEGPPPGQIQATTAERGNDDESSEEMDGAADEMELAHEAIELETDPEVPSPDILERMSVETLIAKGESSFVEFKSTLRVNLHTKEADPKIELSVLKTIAAFLNSKGGGTLIIGVDDNGTALGLEADNFKNEDKMALHFQNLIKDRIGIEHAAHIIPAFEDFAGKRVLRIDCSPSHEPAYVKNGNVETFFIRTGPSTNELPTSKIHAYIKQRFY